VKNTKRERAKSRVVEEIKSVLEFENKIVVPSSYGLTPCCSGRDNGDLIFKTVLENVPPLNNGVTALRSKGVRGKNKLS